MPFKSEKQRRYLWANEPEIAREWTDRYGASEGGITRLPFQDGTILPHGNFPIPDTMDIWGNRRIADEKLDYPPQSLFRKGINQIDNWGKTGLDMGQAALNWAGNKLIGIPGVGFMAGLIQSAGRPDSPYQKEMKNIMGVSGNKDPWGKNIRSFADNYDITDQWDKFAGSKLGQKYGLETLGVDGLTDQEIAQLEAMGLKGYQLNRAKQLSAYNKKAMAWKKNRDKMIMTREDEARRIRKEKAAKEKAEREQAALRQQVRQQAEANRQAGDRGGYQSSFGKDEGFMGGSGTTDDMGSFAEGGLAGLWHRK